MACRGYSAPPEAGEFVGENGTVSKRGTVAKREDRVGVTQRPTTYEYVLSSPTAVGYIETPCRPVVRLPVVGDRDEGLQVRGGPLRRRAP